MTRRFHRAPSWASLWLGVLTVAVTVTGFVCVLAFARLGGMPGATTRIYVTAGSARGVLRGTEVRYDGLKIGAVHGLRFLPLSTDSLQRIVIALDIETLFLPMVRHDSRAVIASGGGLVGDPIIGILGGTTRASEINRGDTLVVTTPQSKIDDAVTEFSGAAQSMPAIFSDVQSIEGTFFSHEGTIGAITSHTGLQHLRQLNRRYAQLSARVFTGRGSAAAFANADASAALVDRAHHALASLDSVQRTINDPRTSLGRFRSDSTLPATLREVAAVLDTTQQLMNAFPSGGLQPPGAVANGPYGGIMTAAWRDSVARGQALIHRIMIDAQHHPERYLAF